MVAGSSPALTRQRERIIVKDNDNLTIERPTFVTHLECAKEGDQYAADEIHSLSKAGTALLVRYGLAGVK
jgi:threonine synthase